MGFVVYDVETSGLNPRFDQILQFAAVRTDAELNIIDRFEARCRLQPSVVPSPEALHITRTSIESLVAPLRSSHYEMVCAIQACFSSWTPSMYLGFNSIKFDEEFLRQAFYQCLFPLYHTNTPNNCRGDVLKLARATATLRPDVLIAPVDPETGRRSFRLADIARANGIDHPNSHDAMSDVEATVAICRRIREGADDLWSSFQRFAAKAKVIDFIREEDAFGLFDYRAGDQEVHPVTMIGAHPENDNLRYCLNLTADLDALRQMDVEEIGELITQDPHVIHRLKVNASPLLCCVWELPAGDLALNTEDDLVRSGGLVRSDEGFVERLVAAAVKTERVYPPSPHIEQQIYDQPWFTNDDKAVCRRFHQVPWEKRLAIAGELQDPRLRRLAARLIYMERPEMLALDTRAAWAARIDARVKDADSDAPWLTLPKALEKLDAMAHDIAAEEDVRRLADLSSYLQQRLLS